MRQFGGGGSMVDSWRDFAAFVSSKKGADRASLARGKEGVPLVLGDI